MSPTLIQTALKQIHQLDSYEKGQLFEQFIIKLFNERFFYLHKWRKSEKLSTSYFSIDYWNPDLEMDLIFAGARKYRFAVECKWRQHFRNGKIEWARNDQICAYRMFQDQARIPVFVAIGIGGMPGDPEKLFLTPLNNIYDRNDLYEKDMIPFQRKPTHRFYYDYIQQSLW